MKKILAFSGSNSPRSINQQLVRHISHLLGDGHTTIVQLADFPMPMFGVEVFEQEGAPASAFALRSLIGAHDGFVIAVNEHNRSVSSLFKNSMDWISKAGNNYNVFESKPILLLGAAPGAGGAQFAISHAQAILLELGGHVTQSYSVPFFYQQVEMQTKEPVFVGPVAEQLEQRIRAFAGRLPLGASHQVPRGA